MWRSTRSRATWSGCSPIPRLGSIELFHLLLVDGGGQGQIVVCAHQRLALPAQDEAQEFLDERLERPAGLAIDVDIEIALQRIAAAGDVRERELTLDAAGGKTDRLDLVGHVRGVT